MKDFERIAIFLSALVLVGFCDGSIGTGPQTWNGNNLVYWSHKPNLVNCHGDDIERGWPTNDYKLFPTIGYYKFHPYGVNWHLARQICEEEGAHLVIVNTVAEADVLKQLFKLNPKVPEALNKEHVWVGVHERGVHGKFFTIFGDKLEDAGYLSWSKTPQQPNDPTPDDCVSFYSSGVMYDDPCTVKYGFVCEVEISKVESVVNDSQMYYVPSPICNERVCPPESDNQYEQLAALINSPLFGQIFSRGNFLDAGQTLPGRVNPGATLPGKPLQPAAPLPGKPGKPGAVAIGPARPVSG